jgi:integrase/recombinase XerD
VPGTQLTLFFNFITQNLDSNLRSPCDTPVLKKLYRPPGLTRWTILEKEVVDEITPYRGDKDRLIDHGSPSQ